jgi:hypothetical protein
VDKSVEKKIEKMLDTPGAGCIMYLVSEKEGRG